MITLRVWYQSKVSQYFFSYQLLVTLHFYDNDRRKLLTTKDIKSNFNNNEK